MDTHVVSGRTCFFDLVPDSSCCLIEAVEGREDLDKEAGLIRKLTARSFSLAAFCVQKWNDELSPWPAPPAFGNVPFGGGAKETLSWTCQSLLPFLKEQTGADVFGLGGYSLAGLFALWAGYESDAFSCIMAASPSVWYPKFLEYAQSKPPRFHSVYLSLGNREEKTRNRMMAPVGDCIRTLEDRYQSQGLGTVLEWNEGGHFAPSEERCAKGWAWLLEHM